MRLILLLIVFMYRMPQAHAQSSLRVHVEKIGNKKGKLYLALYNSDKGYMRPESAWRSIIISLSAVQDTVIDLGILPDGEYAAVMFLDENGNGRLDKNFLGIPSEKYGFSGLNQPLFRAPNFEEASIHLAGEHRTILVSLR